jgi:transposase InsO family protein
MSGKGNGKGNPYDNAKAESFFKTLKAGGVYLKEYRNFTEAHANIGPFIEAVYNRKRPHSALGYLPPAEYEAEFERTSSPVAAELA